jgi:hypothetical protein
MGNESQCWIHRFVNGPEALVPIKEHPPRLGVRPMACLSITMNWLRGISRARSLLNLSFSVLAMIMLQSDREYPYLN